MSGALARASSDAQNAVEPSWVDGHDRLRSRDFQRLATFIHGYSGIKVPPSKATMIEGRLRKRVRALGMRSLDEYCDYLFQRDGLAAEEIHLIDVVTTNKTEFFREPEHFRILAEDVLPRIMAERRVSARAPVKVWSAAASTGAEAYTIAMVLAEQRRRMPDLVGVVYATDICTDVLGTAQGGIFPAEMVSPVPPEMRSRYVMRAKDPASRLVRIVPELRAMVQFGRLNLMDASYPMDRDLDIVFCRNVLIYFDKPTQLAVLRRLCDHLRPGGYLLLGHSETLSGFDLPVRPAGTAVFRRS
ncbi:chemotaxis protein methyltransferase CheR [Rhodoplanes tepidamans]|uniref:Chemotaxis protein methyltransferase n=1 Tax=Rhodoplanes tepidamans TaxID=200616 RepID=A0ABT5JGT2_RHOTP|nr:protein-glutamate O-methyltransferase [Rhodoplanes tepidamans]MDC7788919.1 protein-glutamate O-methyltransferase [Rhodoplanes tepidamans]MDQ0358745.1 chemotaxis protein methyltransferase CheR [Rhodoplanes tepidamans]